MAGFRRCRQPLSLTAKAGLRPLRLDSERRGISRMRLRTCFRFVAGLALAFAVSAQMAPQLTIVPPPTVKVKKGAMETITVKAILPPGFHANSNTPTDAYLIPLTLKWTGGPLEAGEITYPKGAME